jgi:GntR family transcriptional regulator
MECGGQMIRFSIDSSSSVPVFQQVIQAIKLEILSGRLQNGDQLPPIRELAKILKLNPNTVAKAYYTLEEEGFIESKRGSGNWVNTKNMKLDSFRRGMLEDEFRLFLDRALTLGAGLEDIKNLMERYAANESKRP